MSNPDQSTAADEHAAFARWASEHISGDEADWAHWATPAWDAARAPLLARIADLEAALVAPTEAAAVAATVPADLLCYLKNLTIGTFNRHYAHDETYASGQAIWAPCDDMTGLLTQLDNMLTGLSRTPVADQPAEPSPADITLWAVNVHGPDDLYAMPSRAAALEHANELNVYFGEHTGKHEYDPIMRAVVIPWEGSAESHAEDLRTHRAAPKGDSNG